MTYGSLSTRFGRCHTPSLLAILMMVASMFSGTAQPAGISSSDIFDEPGGHTQLTPRAPIYIDSDAEFTPANGVSSGDGTLATPWVIENFDINGSAEGVCIWIGNTTQYFVIRNCTLHHAKGGLYMAAVVMTSLANGRVERCDIYSSFYGIYSIRASYCTFTNLIVRNNTYGLKLAGARSSNRACFNVITDSQFLGNMYGIHMSDIQAVTVSDNVLDCQGVDTPSSNYCEFITSRNGIFDNNTIVCMAKYALRFSTSESDTVSNSNVTAETTPLRFETATNPRAYFNILLGDGVHSIELSSCTNALIQNNTFRNGILMVTAWSTVDHWDSHTIDSTNSVFGKPLYYVKRVSGVVVPRDAGQVLVANSNNVTVSGLSGNATVCMIYTNWSSVSGNDIRGHVNGIYIRDSSNDVVANNSLEVFSSQGIWIYDGTSMVVSDNTLMRNGVGVYLLKTTASLVERNTVYTCGSGIIASSGSPYLNSGTIRDNLIAWSSSYGAIIYNAFVYHNAFLFNGFQASGTTSVSATWDNGYPSGGNYWNDYDGIDGFSGPGQDIPGGDGVGDTPVTIHNTPAQDRYPLMECPFEVDGRHYRNNIRINSNADFDAAHGVNGGSGTAGDPWKIKDWWMADPGDGYCIYVGNTTQPFVIENCSIETADEAYHKDWFPRTGVIFRNVSGGSVVGCAFTNVTRNGALFESSEGCEFVGNTVQSFETGLLVRESSGTRVCGNEFTGCEFAVRLVSSDFNSLVANSMADSTCGMRLDDSNGNEVRDCIISGNLAGIVMFRSDSNVVANNTISGSRMLAAHRAREPAFLENHSSTSGPARPLGVSGNTTADMDYYEAISGVPPYLWYRGCGPTAVGMALGYWDSNGFGDILPGDAGTMTQEVKDALASQGHWEDYSLPIDSTVILPDKSEPPVGDEHANDCLADYMMTSWSSYWMPYGGTLYWAMDDGILSYMNAVASDYFVRAENLHFDGLSWENFCIEIGEGRPMIALVDYNGDTIADHYVTVIGYGLNNRTRMYQCWNTWDTDCSDDWYKWTYSNGASSPFSIYGFVPLRFDINGYGVYLDGCNGNSLFHNDFSDNSRHARDDGTNAWDDGYPSGGNHWSGFECSDGFSGPAQDAPGSDGIGDEPYDDIADATVVDRYPLTAAWTPPTTGLTMVQIPVVPGWNLISLPVDTLAMTLPGQLGDVDTLWDRAMCYAPSTPQDPWRQFSSEWAPSLSDLVRLSPGVGCWLNVTDVGDGHIDVEGYESGSTAIFLRAGWNLVGYPAVDDTLYTVGQLKAATGATVVEGFSAAATYRTRLLEDSYVMKRGEGYWVQVPADVYWFVDW